ncbi:MAG: 30S ribosomal protein S15 [Bacilli bacterium]
MALTKETKAEIIKAYGKDVKDTGSVEVRVALLTKRITELTEHVKLNKKDTSAGRSLLSLVGERRSLLSYLMENDRNSYIELIAKLGLRK